MASRLRFVLFGLLIVGLLALPFYAPPDGHEHAALAQFIGRFHPLIVHLPIALILLVPLLEVAGLRQPLGHLRQAAGIILGLAAASALAATALGWLLAWSGGYRGPLVTRHLWGGVLLSASCLICCGLRMRVPAGRIYPVALLATVLLMAWTSHQGASLTHGTNYLTQYMPAPFRDWLSLSPAAGSERTFYGARVQPILENNCVTCHNPNKHTGDLQLDSYAALLKGGKHGAVVKPGDPKASEMYVRITLPPSDKHFMPTDGKPPLSPQAVKIIELWIAAGASPTLRVEAIKGAPALLGPPPIVVLAPDYRPRLERIRALESALGVRLLPRSQIATDGLVLRTASAPERCTDSALASLKPISDLIVDAEMARTPVTDAGLAAVATWANLRLLDLSHTAITSKGLGPIARLKHLESINLTETSADPASIAQLSRMPTLKHIYSFNLKPAVPKSL